MPQMVILSHVLMWNNVAHILLDAMADVIGAEGLIKMDNQIKMCDSCRHSRYDHCYLHECEYEPRMSCNGCIDHKKKTYKGTKCLDCKRWVFSPGVIVKNIPDCFRRK